jgi:hypothetical protein
MATPERHWHPDDHDEAYAPLVGVPAHDDPKHLEIEDDPWADLGIALVVVGLIVALVWPGF